MSSSGSALVSGAFQAGAINFVVHCPSVPVRNAVGRLFADLAVDSPPEDPVVIWLVDDPATGLELISVDEMAVESFDPEFTLPNLVTAVSRLALDNEPLRLHLHCAALMSNGRGVLVSAPSGTGKSTLAAAMIQRGWTYVSDEAVALSMESTTAVGFAKPLTLDRSAVDLVPASESCRVSLTDDDQAWVVPAGALGASIAQELEPTSIVILQRSLDGETDAPPIAMPLHPADAVVALMGQTMDAERFGPEALYVLSRLVARCRCVVMNVGPLDQAVGSVADLTRSDPQVVDVSALPTLPDGGIDHGWSIPETVRSVLIDDRAVVHATVGGAIVALDEAATAAWQALYGRSPSWWPADGLQHPATVEFLEQLAAYGLVGRSAAARRTSQ